jgi:hypothetical protein
MEPVMSATLYKTGGDHCTADWDLMLCSNGLRNTLGGKPLPDSLRLSLWTAPRSGRVPVTFSTNGSGLFVRAENGEVHGLPISSGRYVRSRPQFARILKQAGGRRVTLWLSMEEVG